MRFIYLLSLLIFLMSCNAKTHPTPVNHDILILKYNDSSSLYAYYDAAGNKVLGDYVMAYTDTLKDYAIVADSGFVLIDKQGKHLYTIFPYDNGPDDASDGLYRILEDGKIGYVDAASAKLVIKPTFDCAYPFENGKAKVSLNCKQIQDSEHSIWESDNWFYIDKNGNKIE